MKFGLFKYGLCHTRMAYFSLTHTRMAQSRAYGQAGAIRIRLQSIQEGLGWFASYVYGLFHTRMSRGMVSLLYYVTRMLADGAEWPYAYETSHTCMVRRCTKSSLFLLLMHFCLDSSLVNFLLMLQTCKHMKHYLKRVK